MSYSDKEIQKVVEGFEERVKELLDENFELRRKIELKNAEIKAIEIERDGLRSLYLKTL